MYQSSLHNDPIGEAMMLQQTGPRAYLSHLSPQLTPSCPRQCLGQRANIVGRKTFAFSLLQQGLPLPHAVLQLGDQVLFLLPQVGQPLPVARCKQFGLSGKDLQGFVLYGRQSRQKLGQF